MMVFGVGFALLETEGCRELVLTGLSVQGGPFGEMV